MFNTQSKNTIKAVVAVMITLIFGEGVLGWGIYWPFLLILLDWEGVYWLVLGSGILISVLRGIPLGLPSLFLLMVIGSLSMVINTRKEVSWIMILIAVVTNFIFDKVFGLDWNLIELLAVVIASLVAVRWFEKGESIRINY